MTTAGHQAQSSKQTFQKQAMGIILTDGYKTNL